MVITIRTRRTFVFIGRNVNTMSLRASNQRNSLTNSRRADDTSPPLACDALRLTTHHITPVIFIHRNGNKKT